jgi:hypothetical protein
MQLWGSDHRWFPAVHAALCRIHTDNYKVLLAADASLDWSLLCPGDACIFRMCLPKQLLNINHV